MSLANPPLLTQSCTNCRLLGACFPQELKADEIRKFNNLVEQQKTLHKGERIFAQGQALNSLYVMRAGVAKTVRTLESGRQVITGFWLPGDILGLNGFHVRRYPEDAIALDTLSVCAISMADFLQLAEHLPHLHQKLECMMSEKMSADSVWQYHHSAEEKLAIFLMGIALRMGRQGHSQHEFRLPMTREDIGAHLGLATETVSRLLVRLEQEGVIQVKRRDVKILDWDKLKVLACDMALYHTE